MRNSLLCSIAIGSGLSAGTGYASCSVEYETVVRGRFVRCESAQFYWDASGADRAIQEMFDRALAERDPVFMNGSVSAGANKTFCLVCADRRLISWQW